MNPINLLKVAKRVSKQNANNTSMFFFTVSDKVLKEKGTKKGISLQAKMEGEIIKRTVSNQKKLEKLKSLGTVDENVKSCNHYGKQYGSSSKK